MPMKIKHIRIVNISDSPKTILDQRLPNGELFVKPNEITYLPYEVYMKVWRRYNDWMIDIDASGNKHYLDSIIEQIDEPLICPHCGKCYDEEVEKQLEEEPTIDEIEKPIPVVKRKCGRPKKK